MESGKSVARRPKAAETCDQPSTAPICLRSALEGKVYDADGRKKFRGFLHTVQGPNKPHRGDRNWVKAGRLNRLPIGYRLTFQRTNPCAFLIKKPFIRLYIQGRGALKAQVGELSAHGRSVPRARAQAKAWAHINENVMISSRPAEAEDRALPGHLGKVQLSPLSGHIMF